MYYSLLVSSNVYFVMFHVQNVPVSIYMIAKRNRGCILLQEKKKRNKLLYKSCFCNPLNKNFEIYTHMICDDCSECMIVREQSEGMMTIFVRNVSESKT